ncbi:MAG: hypothetical protein H6642_18675 [Caldilineaceae bacterium]|nr:hypothetical protein [Caldilineaceae bacterium]MCB9140365.1 hypothetical protein [Caldilineaceae bacterium]
MTVDLNIVDDDGGTLYCANHPETETLLRCNRCNKPICVEKCAVQTDVGYRCKECIRSVQDKYYNAEGRDNWVALGVAFVVTLIAMPIAGLLLSRLGLLFGGLIALLIGSTAGTILAQLIRRAVNKRRGRNMRWFALAGIVLAALVVVLFMPYLLFSLPALIFGVVAVSATLSFLR